MKKEETDQQQASTGPVKQDKASHSDKNEQAKEKDQSKAKDHKHDDDYTILESGLGIDE